MAGRHDGLRRFRVEATGSIVAEENLNLPFGVLP
jgi:hypothetical protein